jgi:hypothetical protein
VITLEPFENMQGQASAEQAIKEPSVSDLISQVNEMTNQIRDRIVGQPSPEPNKEPTPTNLVDSQRQILHSIITKLNGIKDLLRNL